MGPDACKLVTPALIKQQLGVDVATSEPKSSTMQGTTCSFKSENKTSVIVIVQLSANGNMYYQPDSWFKNPIQIGAGDKGIFQGPDSGSTTAELVKNGTLAYVTIYAKAPAYTADQVKGFMKAIADQL